MIKFNIYYNGLTYNNGIIQQKLYVPKHRVFSIDKSHISYKVINDIVYLTIDNTTYILSCDEFQNIKSTLPNTTFSNIV
jgi:hypothetical protein